MPQNTLGFRLDNNSLENPLSIESGLYYWNSGESPVGRVRKDFLQGLPEVKGTIVDLGCSIGNTTKEISELYPDSRVIGIDRFEDRIEKAKLNAPNSEFYVLDAYDLQFPPNSFGAIFCMNNLWYLISKKRTRVPRQVILNLADLLVQEGYLLFSGSGNNAIFQKQEQMQLCTTSISDEAFPYSPQLDFLLRTFSPSTLSSIG